MSMNSKHTWKKNSKLSCNIQFLRYSNTDVVYENHPGETENE